MISFLSLLGAAVSIGVVLYDRHAKLLCRLREGKWIELGKTTTGEPTLRGVVEIYNRSTRPNTISSYQYAARDVRGQWSPLESERYDMNADGVYNATPLVIPPYTGIEVRIACFLRNEQFPKIVEIKATIRDVFDSPYSFPVWMRPTQI